MRCPICSTENHEKARECIACGYLFVTEEKEPESWVLESSSSEDSRIDGYGQAIEEDREESAKENRFMPDQLNQVTEEVRQDEEGGKVSVITVTVPPVERTLADTDYELHTDSLFETLPETEEEEESRKGVGKAVKAPITARETALLIAVAVLVILLLIVLGYFLLSGKLAESIRNFTAPVETESIEESTVPESSAEESVEETSGSEEETSEESETETESSTEETVFVVEQADGSILYDNAFLLAHTDGGYALMSYIGEDAVAEVPADCQGMPVVAVADNAFANRSDVTRVWIPEGVKTIGNGAFYGCSALEVLVLPDSLESIGNNAFDYAGAFIVVSHAGTFAQQYCSQLGIAWAEGDGLPEGNTLPEAAPPAEEPEETSSVPETPAAEEAPEENQEGSLEETALVPESQMPEEEQPLEGAPETSQEEMP